MVLEDFGGIALNQYLQQHNLQTGLTYAKFLPIALQLVNVLGQIHSHHIIHKDINPSNIIYNPKTQQIKIIDFGISTQLARENPSVRNPNVLEGTLSYISPEQTGRMNRAMDYRTDLYSLGITFYELLTGRVPFLAQDPMEIIHSHIAKVPQPAYEVNPQVPEVLSHILMKLMAKTAEARYQSTFGLKEDLQQCLNQHNATGTINPFEVGQTDISKQFQIPQQLYGRETDIATLLAAFERVSAGNTEMMLVAGYSGMGKSALVHEIHKPIVEKRGFFISGKFDQFKRDMPYASLIQAFSELIRQLLTEDDAHIAHWKTRILQALGDNGQVLVDMIPELALIVGEQSPITPLPPAESQNRFNRVFQRFVHIFGASEHPLVIFLDDLQWADTPSLKLIKLLMTDPDDKYILVMGAYRDNEVNSAHPLMVALEEIKQAEAVANTLQLAPLALEHIIALITDTLRCNATEAHPLARLCLEKTQGNPFFLNQFLHAAYDASLIEFMADRGQWHWDIEKIQAYGMTDNVVDF